MNTQKSAILAETQYLRLVQEDHWTYAQRPNVTGAVAIAAITDDNQLLLIDQYRIPVHERVIELPAGLVGDASGCESETIEEAAQRELEEEVGYQATSFRILTTGVSSAGLTDESVHLVHASGLRRVGLGGGDASEDIVVHHIPLDGVVDWIARQRRSGRQIDYKVYAALFFLTRPGGESAKPL